MLNRILALLCLAALTVFTGCTPLHVNRTIALKDATSTGTSQPIPVIDEGQPAPHPYQITGKVTVYRTGTKITKGATTERIQAHAAKMGADGAIGLHRNFGGGLYSALTVKWLPSAEAAKPKDVPFVVSLLPIVVEGKARGDHKKVSDFLRLRLVYLLESKGYYLMPDVVAGFDGSVDDLLKLDDASLQALGGRDTDLLIHITVSGTKEKNIVIGAEAEAALCTTLIEKKSRRVIFQRESVGAQYNGWLINLIDSDDKRAEAAYWGVESALRELLPVGEDVTP